MKSKTPTKSEQKWMDDVRDLGCIVCRNFYGLHSPPAIHHIIGKTKEGAHYHVLPLCLRHHQQKDNQKPPRWISRHGDGRSEFEIEYGHEHALMFSVIELLNNPEHVLEAVNEQA